MTAPATARSDSLGQQIRMASGLTVLVGLWLIVSPFVLGTGFRHGADINDPIIGLVIALLGVARFTGSADNEWSSWALIPFGAWTIISPWVYGFATESPPLRYASLATGIVLLALAVWGALADPERHTALIAERR